MAGPVEQLALALAVAALLSLPGVPIAARTLPAAARPWWPVLAPVAGLAAWLVLTAPLALLAPLGELRPLWLAVPAVAALLAWRWRGRLERPSRAALATLAVAIAAGAVPLVPSLRAGEPVPPAIVLADNFFYASSARWLSEHDARATVPDSRADAFFTPARVARTMPLRLGAEQVSAAPAAALGVDVVLVLPALMALLVAAGCCSIALLALSLGLPAPAAALAAALVATRAESIRLGLDSTYAQALGNVLVPLVLAAGVAWLRRGRTGALALAALAAAALVVGYPEYGPFMVGALGVALAALLARPVALSADASRLGLLRRAGVLAAVAALLAAPALPRALASLQALSALPAVQASRYPSVPDTLALLLGPGHMYGTGALPLALAAALLVLIGAARMPRRGRAAAAGAVVAAAVLLAQLRLGSDFGYGFVKTLNLAGPLLLVLAAGGAAWLWRRRVGRPVAVAAVGGLAIAGAAAAVDLTGRSLDSPFAPAADDVALKRPDAVASDGRLAVALEGVERTGVPMGRLHWALYALRAQAGLEVGYETGISYLLSAAYENPRVYVEQRGDEAYRPDYGYVVSLGPSLSHARPIRRIGRYRVYRRVQDVDVLVASSRWRVPDDSGRPAAATIDADGTGPLRISALAPARVRLALRLSAPRPATVTVSVAGREVGRARIGPGDGVLRTRAFDVPPGRTDAAVHAPPAPDEPHSGVSVRHVAAEPAAG